MLTIKCIQCGKEEEFEHDDFVEEAVDGCGWSIDQETLTADGICPDC
jgi:Fe2+ or Zn2+ uptake regulation protein